MTKKFILKNIEQKFPEIFMLPKHELNLIVKALLYAVKLPSSGELLDKEEHNYLIKSITRKGKTGPANSLLAYRLREGFTQKALAKKSLISQANLSAMENGKRPIGLNVAKKLSKILKCDYKKLV